MEKEDSSSFGRLRSIFWPIHRSEAKKILSMLFLFFFLCISYSMLRSLKDTVILNIAGAEIIPFIKVWGMLPAVIIGTWGFTQLCSRFRREKVFYIVVSSFLIYFLAFAFIFYPLNELFHLTSLHTFLSERLPLGFSGMISMVCYWSCTLFYVISELWAVLVLSILFWGFTNDVTSVSQAKRSYGILNIGSNIAPILGGIIPLLVSNSLASSMIEGSGDLWGQILIRVIVIVTILGIAAMALFYWIQRNVLTEPLKEIGIKDGSKKIRLSVRDSIRYLTKSKYLMSIALLVLGYNISINFTDILWKQQLKTYFTTPSEMNAHMSKISIVVGIVATHGALLFSFMVRRFGWTFVALITPIIMTTMAIGFFTFLFSGDLLSSTAVSLLGVSPLAMTVYFGSMQNALSKAGKYSVFDASKELAFLPLNPESRLKGKAAIDGLGSGVGKSGASLLYQTLIIMTGGIAFCTPYIAVILLVIFSSWIYSALSLGKQFQGKTEPVPEPESDPEIVADVVES